MGLGRTSLSCILLSGLGLFAQGAERVHRSSEGVIHDPQWRIRIFSSSSENPTDSPNAIGPAFAAKDPMPVLTVPAAEPKPVPAAVVKPAAVAKPAAPVKPAEPAKSGPAAVAVPAPAPTPAPVKKVEVAPQSPNPAQAPAKGTPAPAIQTQTAPPPATESKIGTIPEPMWNMPPHGPLMTYEEAYNSIPFRRSEYEANPSYRHDAALELMFGTMRPTTIVRQNLPYFSRYPDFYRYPYFRYPYSRTDLYQHGVMGIPYNVYSRR